MENQTPEQKAKEIIDRSLRHVGWAVQDKDKIDFNASAGVAVKGYMTQNGPADYVLFVNQRPCGVITAKREEEGQRSRSQKGKKAEDIGLGKLKWTADKTALPFIYESTGLFTCFADVRDPIVRPRPVFSFFTPETFVQWLKQGKTLRARLKDIPSLPSQGLRSCQIDAIKNLEKSFKDNRSRALIQMASGSGKTFTAMRLIYRLLKFAGAGRILYLVDTKNLGQQVEQKFMTYRSVVDNKDFIKRYNVRRLSARHIPADTQVCISTIQRMYAILRGAELDESAEILNPNETMYDGRPKEIVYNEKIPIEFFDFIVIDECHRSIYNLWKPVLDYFDAFLTGLISSPDKFTFDFFNKNLVSEYSHEDSIADGINVGFDAYTIGTRIMKRGKIIDAREYLDKRKRLERNKRWSQLDEDITYYSKELNRDATDPEQISKIIKTFKMKLPEFFPGRKEVPKTLILARTDSHANDIIKAILEEFGQGKDFCRKVTHQEKDFEKIIESFRNTPNPRIAVTVDMIAAGIDLKPLECLLFMRDVRSRNYFEQMKGRGSRTCSKELMQKAGTKITHNKTHFVIVDAVGVIRSVKTDSRALEYKRDISLKELLDSMMAGADDEETLISLAGRLVRIEKAMTGSEKKKFTSYALGKTINDVIHELLDTYNPDRVKLAACKKFEILESDKPDKEQLEAVQKNMARKAMSSFNDDLNAYIEKLIKSYG